MTRNPSSFSDDVRQRFARWDRVHLAQISGAAFNLNAKLPRHISGKFPSCLRQKVPRIGRTAIDLMPASSATSFSTGVNAFGRRRLSRLPAHFECRITICRSIGAMARHLPPGPLRSVFSVGRQPASDASDREPSVIAAPAMGHQNPPSAIFRPADMALGGMAPPRWFHTPTTLPVSPPRIRPRPQLKSSAATPTLPSSSRRPSLQPGFWPSHRPRPNISSDDSRHHFTRGPPAAFDETSLRRTRPQAIPAPPQRLFPRCLF